MAAIPCVHCDLQTPSANLSWGNDSGHQPGGPRSGVNAVACFLPRKGTTGSTSSGSRWLRVVGFTKRDYRVVAQAGRSGKRKATGRPKPGLAETAPARAPVGEQQERTNTNAEDNDLDSKVTEFALAAARLAERAGAQAVGTGEGAAPGRASESEQEPVQLAGSALQVPAGTDAREQSTAAGSASGPKSMLTSSMSADEVGQELARLRQERTPGTDVVAKENFWNGVLRETQMIEWPAFTSVIGTTTVVVGIILGSSVVLLTLNALLAQLSDAVFENPAVASFWRL